MRALENVLVAVWTGRSDDQQAIERAFAHLGCSVNQIATGKQLLELAKEHRIQLVATSLSVDFLEPLELLSHREEAALLPPVVVLTDAWGTDLYMEALQLGAFDGLCLPINEKELQRVVCAALHRQLEQVA